MPPLSVTVKLDPDSKVTLAEGGTVTLANPQRQPATTTTRPSRPRSPCSKTRCMATRWCRPAGTSKTGRQKNLSPNSAISGRAPRITLGPFRTSAVTASCCPHRPVSPISANASNVVSGLTEKPVDHHRLHRCLSGARFLVLPTCASIPSGLWPVRPIARAVIGVRSTGAVGLAEKVIAVAQRLLCILVDRNCDRLNVLMAVALTRGALTQFGKRLDPGRVVRVRSYHWSG